MSPQRSGPKRWWVPNDWGEEQALRVAQEVHRLRGSRSAQWLADRTGELGYGISRSLIADLENGRRRYVTTAEVTILARALNTAPINLLYPGESGPEFEAVPGVFTEEIWAAQWFSGLIGPDPNDVRAVSDDYEEYERNMWPLRAARQVWEIGHRKWALLMQLEAPELTGGQRSAILAEVADLQRQIDQWEASHGG